MKFAYCGSRNQAGVYYEESNPVGRVGNRSAILSLCIDPATLQCIAPIPGGSAVNATSSESSFRSVGVYAQASYDITEQLILKWSHAERIFGAGPYPFAELRPFLRRAIQAFGADRIMWASDKTVMFGQSWGDFLYPVRDNPSLSKTEKGWILGGTARRVFSWQVPPPPPVGPNIIR